RRGRAGGAHGRGGQRPRARARPGAQEGAGAVLSRDPPGPPGRLQGAGAGRRCRDRGQGPGADPVDGRPAHVGDGGRLGERGRGVLAGARGQPGVRPLGRAGRRGSLSAGRPRRIAVIPGDGIGREVIAEAVRVLAKADRQYELGLEFEEGLAGGAAIDAVGHPIPPKTVELCRRSDAILLGACGGPKWDRGPRELRPEQALFTLRKTFGIARGRPRRKVTSVDKANVLETSRLWREVATEVAREFSDLTVEHMLVDNCALQLVYNPKQFDVIVTENMFGDILSDEAAGVMGSLGLMPSASLGDGPPGLFEPVHGTAPDIAGKGIANPLAALLTTALLLRYGLGREAPA